MTDMRGSQQTSGAVGKVVALASGLILVFLVTQLREVGSVDVLGLSVPVWLLGVLLYCLGVLGAWATLRGPRS